MTLIVDILSRAARQCSVVPPSNWATATDQTALEVLDFLAETVDDVLERIDVTQPISKTSTITGADAENYPLPSDYKRLHRGTFAVYERFRTRRECMPVSDDGQWEYLKELGSAGAYRFFRVRGYEGAFSIDFFQPLETGITVVVNYVSNNWIVGDKATFTDNGDVSLLPRRLLEAGIVFRFRERKGLEYGDKQAEYEALLARMANDTKTVRKINFGGFQGRGPFDVPVPDFIPSGP
jgi:hypothetical protein